MAGKLTTLQEYVTAFWCKFNGLFSHRFIQPEDFIARLGQLPCTRLFRTPEAQINHRTSGKTSMAGGGWYAPLRAHRSIAMGTMEIFPRKRQIFFRLLTCRHQ